MNENEKYLKAVVQSGRRTGRTYNFCKSLKEGDIVVLADRDSRSAIVDTVLKLHKDNKTPLSITFLTAKEFYNKYENILLDKETGEFKPFQTDIKYKLKIHHCVYDQLMKD